MAMSPRASWPASQPYRGDDEVERKKHEAEEAKRRAELEASLEQAESAFKEQLDRLLAIAFTEGAERAVSAEARRAINVRGYVLLGVVAAVVAMPLIGMLLKLNPQTFGAFIAPVTGIAGTVVGYWFGTVGQSTTQPHGQK
jgi:hypothetical protein